jgi:hypothetical protein
MFTADYMKTGNEKNTKASAENDTAKHQFLNIP